MRNASRMRGSSLVTAIFLLVVLAGLAVAMVTLATSQQTGALLDQQGTRAYLAARAGAEWGVFQVTQANGACVTSAGGTAVATFALPADSTLRGFSVTVDCRRVVDTVTNKARYTVQATACNQPITGTPTGCPHPSNSIDYVQRVVFVEFSAPGVP